LPTVEVELDGKSYIFTGSCWYGKQDHISPPVVIVTRLNKLVQKQLNVDDSKHTNPDYLVTQAQKAREAGQLIRAIHLLRRASAIRPNHVGTATVLSSVLRQAQRPSDALTATERFRTSEYTPLLTSRAAALCDLERWEEAFRLIRHIGVLRNGKYEAEALSVRSRIKAHAPEWFNK
jgi:predicted Zn-dependent protease